MKGRVLEKLAAVICALCLTVGVMSGEVFARAEEPAAELPAEPEATFVVLEQESDTAGEPEGEPEPTAEAVPETETPVPTAEVTDNRDEIPFYVEDELRDILPICGGVPCGKAYDFCRALGMNASTDFSGGTYTVTADGAVIQAAEGDIYFTCNGRYILVEDGVLVRDGQPCLPVEALAKCLGVSVSWDRVNWTLTAADGSDPLESGDTYYDETDVYWLSRVIYAEAGDQPLLGQIAVGDVVLNRVASERFPDTVYDVVFAKNQFDVVINGMIYMEPGGTAVAAAKLALEGYDVSGGATYFATYDFGSGFECVAWIGDHCFMVEA